MAITRPVTRTIISTPDFGIPVTDQLNNLPWSPWQNLTMQNGWQNYPGYAVAGVRRSVGMDLLQLRGMVHSGGQNTVIAVLPAGYRPASTFELLTYVYAGKIDFAQIVVSFNGNVTLNQATWVTGLTGSLYCTIPYVGA